MKTMKATLHIGRLKGKSSGKHNDRSFDTEKNDSIIHPELARYNVYYVTDENGKFQPVEGGKGAFEKREREFYKTHFSDSLKAKNDRYRAEGHKERCKTITEVRKGERTAPTEIILQVGNEKNPYLDGSKFRQMAQVFMQELRKNYPNFKILNFAIHCEETSMHVHARGVFTAKNRDGYDEPNQTKALQEMGFGMPAPTAKRSRENNEMVVFTEKIRNQWQDTIEMIDPEISIDREVTDRGKRHQKTLKGDVQQLEEQRSELQHEIDYLMTRTAREQEKLTKIRQNVLETDYSRFEAMEQFIDEKNLKNEFEEFYENLFEMQYEYE